MSIHSKARRDARRKKQPAAAVAPTRPIRVHAKLVDCEGTNVGGAGLRGDDWVLVLAGRVVATTNSASMMIAMLRRTVAVRQQGGEHLRLDCTRTLLDAATREAALVDRTLEEHLLALEAERAEHALRKQRVAEPGAAH